jgi:hypothetical protein
MRLSVILLLVVLVIATLSPLTLRFPSTQPHKMECLASLDVCHASTSSVLADADVFVLSEYACKHAPLMVSKPFRRIDAFFSQPPFSALIERPPNVLPYVL